MDGDKINMIKQQNVLGEDWKYLVVLDACRYDYFEKNHSHFVDGKLERRISPARYTPEWLEKTFVDYYEDIIYISPVFFCNSVKRRKNISFFGKDHFFKVVNAWRDGWDNEYGTVTPWYIYDKAKKSSLSYPNKRIVVHFFQPHAPYLSIKPTIKNKRKNPKSQKKIDIKKIMKKRASTVFHRLFGTESLWKIIQMCKMDPRTNMEEAWRRVGVDGIREAYEMNLKTVLFFVEKLSRSLPSGKMIITADHGELLGEKRFWGHGPPKPRLPELSDVPWFEVERKQIKEEKNGENSI